jgi:hypothetical protein
VIDTEVVQTRIIRLVVARHTQIQKTKISSLASLKKHGSPNTIEKKERHGNFNRHHQLASGRGSCQRNTVSPAVLEQSLLPRINGKTARKDATPSSSNELSAAIWPSCATWCCRNKQQLFFFLQQFQQ